MKSGLFAIHLGFEHLLGGEQIVPLGKEFITFFITVLRLAVVEFECFVEKIHVRHLFPYCSPIFFLSASSSFSISLSVESSALASFAMSISSSALSSALDEV